MRSIKKFIGEYNIDHGYVINLGEIEKVDNIYN